MPRLTIPATFTSKKAQILSALATPDTKYTDKSPKGSVDEQIRELIDKINGYEGLVTTSSCAGRVAVFVEGERTQSRVGISDETEDDGLGEGREGDYQEGSVVVTSSKRLPTVGPGGKGGGRWLYVSHERIDVDNDGQARSFTELFGLHRQTSSDTLLGLTAASEPDDNVAAGLAGLPRLVRLSFSPLILHIFCASLLHARPLLTAAINAGFRESGVQSLKGLDDVGAGAMVAVRTAGLGFESVVGIVDQDDKVRCVASEGYLAMCVQVINERFQWNDVRRERFRENLTQAMKVEQLRGVETGWEDKEQRKMRKREEGLKKRAALQKPNELSRNGFPEGDGEDITLDIHIKGLDLS